MGGCQVGTVESLKPMVDAFMTGDKKVSFL
jgi:hypothetical protein